MRVDKMVVRFKDKSILKGRTTDFSVNNHEFHLKLLSGEIVKIDMEKIKAAFMVKSFAGNKNYVYTYKDFLPWEGNKIKVEFIDGEVIIGYSQHYANNRKGFFITPADLKGNNKQVYVVQSATKDITFL